MEIRNWHLQPCQGCSWLEGFDPREGFAHPGVTQEKPLRGIFVSLWIGGEGEDCGGGEGGGGSGDVGGGEGVDGVDDIGGGHGARGDGCGAGDAEDAALDVGG